MVKHMYIVFQLDFIYLNCVLLNDPIELLDGYVVQSQSECQRTTFFSSVSNNQNNSHKDAKVREMIIMSVFFFAPLRLREKNYFYLLGRY